MPKKLAHNIEFTTERDIANCFNDYFASIGKTLASKFSNSTSIQDNVKTAPENPQASFFFSRINSELTIALLNQINARKATGLDQLPATLVKLSASVIAVPLTHIINESLVSSVFPDSLKIAKVKPLHKKGATDECCNYRPISILPIFSKIFEKVINSQICSYLEREKLLNAEQYGFRKNKSTSLALIDFTNSVFNAMNNGNSVLGIFLDFSKAFDTIDHHILLTKLSGLNFNQTSIQLLKSYLTNRKQVTVINEAVSTSKDINCGIPQGSILGPTLFLIYINDLPKITKLLKPILYADDTNLFFEAKDLNMRINDINAELKLVETWCNSNKLTLNLNKTNYIVLKTHQNRKILQKNCLMVGSNFIHDEKTIKFLGVEIDTQLTWKVHIEKLCAKIRPFVGLLYKCSKYFPRKVLKTIYNSFIHSKISYCLESWGNAPMTSLDLIYKLQKKLLRIIFDKPPLEHSTPLFIKASVLPVKLLFNFKILICAHNLFYSKLSHTNHDYPTRISDVNLLLPPSSTAVGHRRVEYQCASMWNSLPTAVRAIASPLGFRIALRDHLFASISA